jgi:hypothetical protein
MKFFNLKSKVSLKYLSKLQLVAFFTAAVVSLGVLNVGLSNYYLSQILNSIESSEAIMEKAKKDFSQKYPPSSNDEILNRLRKIVRDSRTELILENYKLININVNVMGSEFKPAIKAFTEHSDSWVDWYERIEACSEVDCLSRELQKPNTISATFRIAEEAFKQVVPIIDLVDARQRIADEFNE